jgi:hypothetical protein
MKIRGMCGPPVKILYCEPCTPWCLLSSIRPTPAETRLPSRILPELPPAVLWDKLLPHGYNDLTHAEQRMTIQFMNIAFQNIAAEFQPQWGPIVRKLRIQKILPEWRVPQHKK